MGVELLSRLPTRTPSRLPSHGPTDGVGGWWPAGSVLAFEFDNGRGYNSTALSSRTPDSLLTYTSPSPKLVYGDDGVLGYAPHNLLTYSEQFDNAAWTKSNNTVTANQVAGPDGAVTADLVVPTATSGGHLVFQHPSTGAVTHTLSMYYKPAGYAKVALRESAVSGQYASFNCTGSGSIIEKHASAAATITALADGWYKLTLSPSIETANQGFSIYIFDDSYASGAPPAYSYSGDTVKGGYVVGAQLNRSSSALTYIPTTTAAVYSLPIDHNPTTFEPLGVLIEEQRTNLLTYSDQFDNAAWTKANATITANQLAAPDGALTADLMTNVVGNNRMTATATTSAIAYCYSQFFKKGNHSAVCLQAYSSVSALIGSIDYDFDTDTLTDAVGTSERKLLPDGWVRVTLKFTAADASTVLWTRIGTAASSGVDGATGYVWGAQLEAGAFPTSYIPTVASQVTRAADQVSIPTSAFAYSATEGTLVAGFVPVSAVITAGSARVASIMASAGPNADHFYLRTSNTAMGVVTAANVQVAVLDGGTLTASSLNKFAMAFAANDFAMSLDGGAVATDVGGDMPTGIDILYVGTYNTANHLNGHIKRLTYFPTRKTDAELQALST
jgi:hypothetical protein